MYDKRCCKNIPECLFRFIQRNLAVVTDHADQSQRHDGGAVYDLVSHQPKNGFTIGEAGIVFGLFGAGAFSGAWLGGRMTDKIGFYPVQLITLVGGGLLFFALGQMKTYPLICIFTFLLSFVNEAFRPANSTAIAFYSKEENRTRSYALNRLAQSKI